MVTKKESLEYLNKAAKASKALPVKELQAERLKAINVKIEEVKSKIDKCMSQHNRVPMEYTENYNKLLKQRKKIESWDV